MVEKTKRTTAETVDWELVEPTADALPTHADTPTILFVAADTPTPTQTDTPTHTPTHFANVGFDKAFVGVAKTIIVGGSAYIIIIVAADIADTIIEKVGKIMDALWVLTKAGLQIVGVGLGIYAAYKVLTGIKSDTPSVQDRTTTRHSNNTIVNNFYINNNNKIDEGGN